MLIGGCFCGQICRRTSGAPMRFRSTAKGTRTSSRLAWIKLADGLPEYRERRPEEDRP